MLVFHKIDPFASVDIIFLLLLKEACMLKKPICQETKDYIDANFKATWTSDQISCKTMNSVKLFEILEVKPWNETATPCCSLISVFPWCSQGEGVGYIIREFQHTEHMSLTPTLNLTLTPNPTLTLILKGRFIQIYWLWTQQ